MLHLWPYKVMIKLSGFKAFTGGVKMQNLLNAGHGKTTKSYLFCHNNVICLLYSVLQFTALEYGLGTDEKKKRKYIIERIRILISSVQLYQTCKKLNFGKQSSSNNSVNIYFELIK